jgi:hypothetical protein
MHSSREACLSTKICKKCGQRLDSSHFYTKGNRLDSKCKTCILGLKRTVYRRKRGAMRIRQIEFGRLRMEKTVYNGTLPSPTLDQQYDLLTAFVMEEVILGSENGQHIETR